MRAWMLPLLLVLCGAAVTAGLVARGDRVEAVAPLLVFVLLAGVYSPSIFPRGVSALETQRLSPVDGRPIVFWRPGCKYCMRLRLRLGFKARHLHWVNIWRDPAGPAPIPHPHGFASSSLSDLRIVSE